MVVRTTGLSTKKHEPSVRTCGSSRNEQDYYRNDDHQWVKTNLSRDVKRNEGPAFAVRIHTENQDQASFCPFALREVSVLAELALGHLRYHLTDDRPSQKPPESVLGADARYKEAARLGPRSVILTGRFPLNETAADIGYGPARKLHISIGFSRANRAHRHRKRRGLLHENRHLSRTSRFPGDTNLTKKRKNLPGSVGRLGVRLRYRTGPKDLAPCRVGEYNPIPFRSQRDQTRACVAFSADVSTFGTDFSITRTDAPCSTALHGNPSPASVIKALTEYCYSPRSALSPPWRSAGSRPAPVNARHRDFLLTAALNLQRKLCRSGPGSGPTLSVIIFRASCFVGSCYTLLSDSGFHDAIVDCLEQPKHLSWGS
ncbi:hypothetical protein JTE90_022083 [Oedothorax gibbosus]|uniref:Senescence-associated protein n=1 Tax=Oedothorax gibbosus TaxID=931172 RepID=A0AAV6TFD9_9ARAC|nr:hypothetical protein JTE90_022083 [Oedothorax gibbosus]